MRVTVIGGGITGLTAAYRLHKQGHAVTCVDPGPRPGGLMRSERRDGFTCEVGPQALLDSAPDTRALITELDLTDRVVRSSRSAKRRFIYVRGRLRAVPTHPLKLVTSDLLTWPGKWRALREPFVPPRAEAYAPAADRPPRGGTAERDDESVLAFAERRLGPEVARNVVAPALIGIFAGDAARLSVRAATPRMFDLEDQHGSLWKGLRKIRGAGMTGAGLISFRDGLAELPAALARQLGTRFVTARATAIREAAGKWMVDVQAAGAGAASPPPLPAADVLILAAGATATANLLERISPAAAVALRQIPAVSVTVVYLGFAGEDIGVDLDAYGFLVARGEGPTILGCQYDSSVFPDRVPTGGTLLRVLVGGAFEPGQAALPDGDLVRSVTDDLRTIAGLRAEPTFSAIFRHRNAIPQYELGHLELVQGIEAACREFLGLHLLGYSLRGVGVNDCIRNAGDLARLIGPAGQTPATGSPAHPR